MTDEEIKDLIMKKQKDRRIACAVAFDIAEEAGVSRRKVGRLLDELEIKIHSCQLGCFE